MSLRDLARAAGIAEDDEELLALLLAEEGVELAESAARSSADGRPARRRSPSPRSGSGSSTA